MRRHEGLPDEVSHPLDRALDRLMAGQKAITLPYIDRNHLEYLKNASDRMAMTLVEGSRLHPEKGYVYRTACCFGNLGVVLRLNVPIAADDEDDAMLTVESVFASEEFSGTRSTIRKCDASQVHGVSQALIDQYRPKVIEMDDTLDLEIDIPSIMPTMR